jgi:hypothetical protein
MGAVLRTACMRRMMRDRSLGREKDVKRSGRTGAAGGETDAESGLDDGDDRRRALAALEAMLRRGLIDRDTFERRKAEIEAPG